MSSCCCHDALVRYELAGAPCALLALLTGVRLPAGGRTLVCPSALCLPARALALRCPAAGCRLPAGSRDPAVVTGCPHPSPGMPCPSRMAVASGGCSSACRVACPALGRVLIDKQPGKGPQHPSSVKMGFALCARGAKQPGAGTPAPRVPPLWPSFGDANSQGWARTPRSRWAHHFLGPSHLVPYSAPRARLPLFYFRPPSPCPWAAAITHRASTGPKQGSCAAAGVCW